MRPDYDYGQRVRVIRTLRDDGTYPGRSRGDLLVRRGSIGYVRDVGTFLQEQIIYRVHFVVEGIQVGCREEELIDADAPWQETRFEFRQPVLAARALAVRGQVLVAAGDAGQVLKVLRDHPDGVRYQVRFPGRTLEVSETALQEVTL